MRRSRWLANPRSQRRLSHALAVVSAVTGASAAALRQALDAGDDRWTLTFLLDLLALVLAVLGAALAARVSSFMAAFPGGADRRLAIIQAVGGLAAFLAGCVVLPALIDTSQDWFAVPLAALLYGGLAVLLAGMGRLLVEAGAPYMEGRIERLSDDEAWR